MGQDLSVNDGIMLGGRSPEERGGRICYEYGELNNEKSGGYIGKSQPE